MSGELVCDTKWMIWCPCFHVFTWTALCSLWQYTYKRTTSGKSTHGDRKKGPPLCRGVLTKKIMNKSYCCLFTISLKFVPRCSIDNTSSLVQGMVWCCPGDIFYRNEKWPSSLMYICNTNSIVKLSCPRWYLYLYELLTLLRSWLCRNQFTFDVSLW